jgi:flagellar biogenesis protein FliO
MSDSPLLLLALLAVLLAVPLVLRRFKANTPDAVRVVGRTALHKGAVVAVVAVGERRMLVGATDRGVQMLVELDRDPTAGPLPADGDPSATATPLAASFAPPQRPNRTDAVRSVLEDRLVDVASIPGRDGEHLSAGPRTGLVDRLRAMTVRTPVQGRPLRVPFRR